MAEKALRLGTPDNALVVNLDGASTGTSTVPINADTLGGAAASSFVRNDTSNTLNGGTYLNASTYMRNGVYYNGYDTNGTACCLIGLNTDNVLYVGSGTYPHPGDTVIKSNNGRIILNGGNTNMYFTIAGASYTTTGSDAYCVLRFLRDGEVSYFRCQGDGLGQLGSSSYKWKNVFATNGQIQTSDRNLKKNIQDIDDRYIQLFDLVRPVSYQLIKGDRIHTGFIAQEVEDAMEKVGLTAEELAFFCRDIKVTTDPEDPEKDIPVLDDNGNPVYIYSLRYEEYIAIIAEKVRRLEAKHNEEMKKLEEKYEQRIKALEEAIAKLTSVNE